MLEQRQYCGHNPNGGWCDYCTQLWKEAYEKGIRESHNKKIAYICKTDYYHELGSALDPTQIFSSLESLKLHKKCWKDCEVFQIEMSIKKSIED